MKIQLGILLLMTLLQATLGDLLRVGPRAPDLMLVAVLWLLPAFSPAMAAIFGFACGLLLDALGTDPFGAAALAATSAGFFAALLLDPSRKHVYWLRLLRALLILVPLQILLGQMRWFGLDVNPLTQIFAVSLPSALYSWFCYALLSLAPMGTAKTK